LFVIDGVIFSFDDNASDGITLSPKEIEDITVIKGSSATSIYGEQGKNGVVIITTKKGLEAALQVEARTDLKETAFFYPNMTTDSEGRIQVHFDTPQALTKWRFMLLAHTRDLAFGKLEKTVLTQKDLSIVPNYPRFIREKDSIQFSTKISNLTEKPISGIAILQLFDAITNIPINEIIQDNTQNKNFTIPAGNDVNVSWRIRIPEGLNAMQFKVMAKAGDIADGETKIIPVLSNRVLITESQPLWVQPGNTKEIRLDGLSANSSQSLNNYRFTIEYTSNPAWFAIKSLPFLIEFPYECAEQTFARFYANAIAGDIVQKNPPIESVFRSWAQDTFEDSPLEKNEDLKSVLLSESPWVREAGEESRNKARLASIFQKELLIEKQALSISKLKDMQLPSGGFPWFSGGRENNFITRYIVAGFGHLDKLGIASEYKSDVDLIVRKAVDYLDKDFIDSYKEQILESRDSSDFRLTNNAIHYLYMRSFNRGQNPLSEELEKITKRYLDACGKSWLTESLYNQGMIALVAHRFGEKELSIKILNALEEQAVYSEENGTYWKRNDGGYYWYKAPIETQALLIEAFSEIRNDIKLLDGLKLWLLKNKRTHQWNSTKATSEAIYALLMHGSNWLSVSDNTTITLGNDRISNSKLDAVKKEAGTGYFKINWNKEEITPKMGNVKVENKSEVTGFGGIYWQYFEDLDKVAATKGVPLVVRKEIFKKEITETGERLNPIQENSDLKLGDVLTVRLEVISKESLEFIHLKDLRASGLEPLDVLSEYKWQDGLGYYQSTKDVATHFFFDNLPEGTYVFEYDLRINNVGNFAAGISTIQSMYAPEYSAHSEGKRISFE